MGNRIFGTFRKTGNYQHTGKFIHKHQSPQKTVLKIVKRLNIHLWYHSYPLKKVTRNISFLHIHTITDIPYLCLLINLMVQTNGTVALHTAPPECWVLVVVLIQHVHLVLLSVEVVEQPPDKASSDERSARETSKEVLDRRVVENGVEGLGDGGSESVGKEVHGLDKGLHAGWGLGVGILETSDGGEDLRDTNEHVSTSLCGNMNVVALVNAIDKVSVAEGFTVAGSGLVDVVLNDAGVDHGERSNPETSYNTVDRRERNLVLAERRHEPLVDKGQEDDDGNGVEVLHEIVGDSVTTHLTSLSDEVVGEVAVYDPVDGVEAEDLASNESTLELIDKVVIPVESDVLSKSSLVRGLSSVELASLHHHPHCTEGVSDDRSLRWSDDVDLAAENENKKTDEEDAETQEVSRPEVNVTLHVWGGKQGERSSVDTPVEDLRELAIFRAGQESMMLTM